MNLTPMLRLLVAIAAGLAVLLVLVLLDAGPLHLLFAVLVGALLWYTLRPHPSRRAWNRCGQSRS